MSSLSFPGSAGTSIPTSMLSAATVSLSFVLPMSVQTDSGGWKRISSSPASCRARAFSGSMVAV